MKESRLAKLVIGLLLASLIITCSYYLSDYVYFDAEYTGNQKKQEQLNSLVRDNKENEQLAANLSQLENDLAEADMKARGLKTIIPTQSELPAVLSWLSDRAAERGLKLERFNQVSEVKKDPISEVLINCEVSGNFDSASRFIEDFARYERILRVNSAQLSQLQNQSDSSTVDTIINFSAYVGKDSNPQNIRVAKN